MMKREEDDTKEAPPSANEGSSPSEMGWNSHVLKRLEWLKPLILLVESSICLEACLQGHWGQTERKAASSGTGS